MNKKYILIGVAIVAIIIILIIINNQNKKNKALEQQIILLQQQQSIKPQSGGFDWLNFFGGTVNSFLGGLGAGIGASTGNSNTGTVTNPPRN